MNGEEFRDRMHGVIRAAADGAWEAILSVASFPTVVAHKRYVARTLEGDAFETSFEWARDQIKVRCRLCAAPIRERFDGSPIRASFEVRGRTICVECGHAAASAAAAPYTKFLEDSVRKLGDTLSSKLAVSQDTTLTPPPRP